MDQTERALQSTNRVVMKLLARYLGIFLLVGAICFGITVSLT